MSLRPNRRMQRRPARTPRDEPEHGRAWDESQEFIVAGAVRKRVALRPP
jgi:hypothetical protein